MHPPIRPILLFIFAVGAYTFMPAVVGQTCALDVFVANDQSGSVSAIENTQSRQFISALFSGMQPWGTGAGQSRMAIADWDSPGVWQQFNYPVAGQNYTPLLADVLAYQNAPRALLGGTDPYTALLSTYQQIGQTPIAGRVSHPVIVLMTDAACVQVPAGLSTLATQIKNAGVYIIVVAIEAASFCPSLMGANVASPGGYFSAPTYAQLVQANVQLVQQMINAGCTGSVDPSYDLAITLDAFTASGCISPPAMFSVDYAVANGPGADFNGPLVISFYNADPALPTTALLAVQNVGVVSIPMNGTFTGSYANAALGGSNVLYAIVNFNGNAAGHAPPITSLSHTDMVVADEWATFNNTSAPVNRFNDPVTCPPQATITSTIVSGGLGCNDLATYEITICNTGDAAAYINPTLPITVPGAVLVNNVFQTGTFSDELDWATYYGGTNLEEGTAVAVDPAGNVYLAGTTRSTASIATVGSHQAAAPGNRNAFLAKFTPAGVRIWATYYGGSGNDYGQSVTTDATGNVYLVGFTESNASIATAGAHQTVFGGSSDAFIVKFNSAGVRQWASYCGGSGVEEGYSVATDATGNVFLAGTTQGSTTLATAGAHQTVFAGIEDQFLVKFNSAGVRQWATYYGGPGQETLGNVACDPSGNVYLTGETQSTAGIATAGAHMSTSVSDDVYLAKFNGAGVRQWATYFGGPDVEEQPSVVCNASGDVFLSGTTDSDVDIAFNALHQGFRGGGKDGFVTRFDGAGTQIWGTYIGGGDADEARDLAIDPSGKILVAGSTISVAGIATIGSYQTLTDGVLDDAFLVKFMDDGSLSWGTYYGGAGPETQYSVACDAGGDAYIAGFTSSTSLVATTGAHQTLYNGSDDAYLAKFGEHELPRILFPGECFVREYIYDYSAVAAGTYNLSMGIAATIYSPGDPSPNVLPDQNFNAGTYVNISGFNGAVHTSDNVVVPATGTACSPGPQISIAVNIPAVNSCGNGNYAQATVTITNNSGVVASNTDLHLNLVGVGATFASELYNNSAGLNFSQPNVLDPFYPFVPYAIYGQTADQYLPLLDIPPGISTFQVDINVGSTLTNLFAQIDSIHPGLNITGQSNLASDATGVAALTVPTISGFTCPGSILAGANVVLNGIAVTGAASVQWASTTVPSAIGGGTVSAPTLTYVPTPLDVANGFVAISLTALSASGCDAAETCQIDITNVQYDYGDAPVVYDMNVNYQPPAAASTLFSGLFLGNAGPDTEVLANNSVLADGDGLEEDALLSNPYAVPYPPAGASFTLPARATNNSASRSFLHAYVDWDADGDFMDSLESSLNTVTIPALSGSQLRNMLFTVPPFVNTAGLFYIRLRLSVDSMSTTVPYMAAPRGETEDYVWASVGPLPIELLSFTGHEEGEDVRLNWTTATESNSDVFLVERSQEGTSFDQVGSIDAAGYSQMVTTYSLLDRYALPGTSFYRLKQVDNNGSIAYYGPVVITRVNGHTQWIQYITDNVIRIQGIDPRITSISFHDSIGRLYALALAPDGSVDVSALPGGVYLASLSVAGQPTLSLRFVVR